jgi:hypothetical protein
MNVLKPRLLLLNLVHALPTLCLKLVLPLPHLALQLRLLILGGPHLTHHLPHLVKLAVAQLPELVHAFLLMLLVDRVLGSLHLLHGIVVDLVDHVVLGDFDQLHVVVELLLPKISLALVKDTPAFLVVRSHGAHLIRLVGQHVFNDARLAVAELVGELAAKRVLLPLVLLVQYLLDRLQPLVLWQGAQLTR